MKEKLLIGFRIISIYLILIAFYLIITSSLWYFVEKDINRSVFKAMERRIDDVKTGVKKMGLLPGKDQKEFDSLLEGYKQFVSNYKVNYVDNFRILSFITVIVGILAGFLYFFSAMCLANLSRKARNRIFYAMVSFLLFNFILLFYSYSTLNIMHQSFEKLSFLYSFYGKEKMVDHFGKIYSITIAYYLSHVGIMILIFVMIPFYFITKKSVREKLL